MTVIDPNDNPMSFPVVQHILKSPSLVHALQSVSANYEAYFNDNDISTCLEERHRALASLQEELKHGSKPLASTFLTVFMLGMTSSWIEGKLSTFGKENLYGARAIIHSVVEDAISNAKNDLSVQFIIGSYNLQGHVLLFPHEF